MEIKLIKQLAKNSFSDKKLDSKKVFGIVERLTRRQLKEYIAQLKRYILENTVIVETAYPVSVQSKKLFEETYKEKNIEYINNKELMVGVKIYENDIITSKNLRDTLENVKNYIVK